MNSATRSFHTANKNLLGEWLVGRVLLQGALRRAFGGVYARIDPATLHLRDQAHLPVIFCATHSGWWDGHMAYILNKRIFRRDAYLMMEEAQLARYSFFSWAGAFGVDKHNAHNALESIKYVTNIVSERSNRALWIFPQGEMSHPDVRPIRVYRGATNIARRLGDCALVPVAFRYDFLREQAPDAFANVGAPLLVREKESRPVSLTPRLTEAMTRVADELRESVTLHKFEPYQRVLKGRASSNTNWDRVRTFARQIISGSPGKRSGGS
ncbi:MAG TPA: lysophospholipid acyltransferase family protein [Chloroflexia bacterium]|nr:lysophospholipid acyltransferase family protein [Chloroflexia bacterium]